MKLVSGIIKLVILGLGTVLVIFMLSGLVNDEFDKDKFVLYPNNFNGFSRNFTEEELKDKFLELGVQQEGSISEDVPTDDIAGGNIKKADSLKGRFIQNLYKNVGIRFHNGNKYEFGGVHEGYNCTLCSSSPLQRAVKDSPDEEIKKKDITTGSVADLLEKALSDSTLFSVYKFKGVKAIYNKNSNKYYTDIITHTVDTDAISAGDIIQTNSEGGGSHTRAVFYVGDGFLVTVEDSAGKTPKIGADKVLDKYVNEALLYYKNLLGVETNIKDLYISRKYKEGSFDTVRFRYYAIDKEKKQFKGSNAPGGSFPITNLIKLNDLP